MLHSLHINSRYTLDEHPTIRSDGISTLIVDVVAIFPLYDTSQLLESCFCFSPDTVYRFKDV